MKTRSNSAGIALVIVMACLVLLVVIITGFMASSRNAMNLAAQGAAQQRARALSEQALNIVMGQIRDATLNGVGINAWASQPGAIRVWNEKGELEKVYKLYSASVMQTDSLGFLNVTSGNAMDVPSDWEDKIGQYVDLNQPAMDANGAWVYPILNPAVISSTITAPAGTSAGIQGFEVDDGANSIGSSEQWDARAAMPVKWLYILQEGQLIAPDADSTDTVTFQNAATRPSKDNPIVGRVAFWTDDESCKININTASATTRGEGQGSAPQINIDDSYWAVPQTGFYQDRCYGKNPPVEGEFQRYMGHPATVNLLSVFGNPALSASQQMINMLGLTPYYQWGGSKNGSRSAVLMYIDYLKDEDPQNDLVSLRDVNAPTDRLYASVDELQFSGTGAVLGTGVNRGLNNARLPLKLGSAEFPSIAKMLDTTHFFLTAHSRASDLNLYGQPRVTIWPVSVDTSTASRTVYDQCIAFCSTLGSGSDAKAYMFQRVNAYSQTADFDITATPRPRNIDLFAYLQNITAKPIPGYGGNFLDKYDKHYGGVDGEWDQILTEIFDYIRCVNLNETWSGAPAAHKHYTTGVTKSLSQSTAGNQMDFFKNYPGAGFVMPIKIDQTPVRAYATRGAGRAPTLSEVALFMIQRGNFDVVVAGLGTHVVPLSPPDPDNPSHCTGTSNRLQTALVFETFSPMQGYMPYLPPAQAGISGTEYSYTFSAEMPVPIMISGSVGTTTGTDGKEVMVVADFPVFEPPATGTATFHVTAASAEEQNVKLGGADGPRWLAPGNRYAIDKAAAPGSWQGFEYPFLRREDRAIPISPESTSVLLKRGTLRVSLTAGNIKYQEIELEFPEKDLPVPDPVQVWNWSGTDQNGAGEWVRYSECYTGTTTGTARWSDWENRFRTHSVYMRERVPRVLVQPDGRGDVCQGVMSRDGDHRIMAYLDKVPQGFYKEHRDFGVNRRAHTLTGPERTMTTGASMGGYVTSATYGVAHYAQDIHNRWAQDYPYVIGGRDPAGNANLWDLGSTYAAAGIRPKINPRITDLIQDVDSSSGDWENGMGLFPDGAYLRKPDEGVLASNLDDASMPYIGVNLWFRQVGFFSPTRQMPSAVMFGALPTGVKRTEAAYRRITSFDDSSKVDARPWRTLLFCPNPDIANFPSASNPASPHYGFGKPAPSDIGVDIIPGGTKVVPTNGFSDPPDRLLLDLFTMPVVEPYPISDSFSTAGRINMNQQIVPFTGITRYTGLHAVLSSQRVPAIPSTPTTYSYDYKIAGGGSLRMSRSVDIPETLKQFSDVFAPGGHPEHGDIFHSATDICGLYLVPQNVTLNTVKGNGNVTNGWWKDHRLTGDNLRERPYTFLYPLLTTKSNVYTVHVWAQALKKVPDTNPEEFVVGRDQVLSEYRGKSTFERFLDPRDDRLIGGAIGNINPDEHPLEELYRYRVIDTKQFAP